MSIACGTSNWWWKLHNMCKCKMLGLSLIQFIWNFNVENPLNCSTLSANGGPSMEPGTWKYEECPYIFQTSPQMAVQISCFEYQRLKVPTFQISYYLIPLRQCMHTHPNLWDIYLHLANDKTACEPGNLVFIKDCLIHLHAGADSYYGDGIG